MAPRKKDLDPAVGGGWPGREVTSFGDGPSHISRACRRPTGARISNDASRTEHEQTTRRFAGPTRRGCLRFPG